MTTTLTQNQARTYAKNWTENGQVHNLVATVRYDDQCGNGYNTFSITGELKIDRRLDSGGCLHELIAEHFLELAPLIKWHLCSSDGPMHYVANTLYHASDKDCHGLRKGKARELDHARSSAIWPDATDEELMADNLRETLDARLPGLLAEFRQVVESLGFVF